jgi:putative endonuclease
MVTSKRSSLGNEGEQQVALYLQQQGFSIIERNYQKFFGEIDIIALREDLLVFVEVKTRRTAGKFDLAGLVLPSKQRKISLVAREYITRHNHIDKVCRFDVALVEGASDTAHITYIPEAFVSYE